jgi:hypothetical protein
MVGLTVVQVELILKLVSSLFLIVENVASSLKGVIDSDKELTVEEKAKLIEKINKNRLPAWEDLGK